MTTTEDDLTETRKYRAPALEKGLDVLELLTAHGRPMTPSQMSSLLGRSVNELFRMIQVLEFRGYIEARPEGYRLTNRLFALGMTQAPVKALVEVALPAMQQLANATFHSCHLVVRSGDQIVVILRVESPGELGYSVRVGYRRRLIEATSGLILYGLATPLAKQQMRTVLEDVHGVERMQAFAAKAEAAALDRYVVRPSEFVTAVTDLCTPILGAEGVIATLNLPYLAQSAPSCDMPTALSHLRRTAAEISAEMALAGGV